MSSIQLEIESLITEIERALSKINYNAPKEFWAIYEQIDSYSGFDERTFNQLTRAKELLPC